MAHAPSLQAHVEHVTAGTRLAQLMQRGWAAYWHRRARTATVEILNRLDDRALKDIGLHRSEIDSVVYAAREERRTAVDL